MFKNILVPTDLTERRLKALDIAVHIDSKDDFKVTLLHVIQTIDKAEEKEFRLPSCRSGSWVVSSGDIQGHPGALCYGKKSATQSEVQRCDTHKTVLINREIKTKGSCYDLTGVLEARIISYKAVLGVLCLLFV